MGDDVENAHIVFSTAWGDDVENPIHNQVQLLTFNKQGKFAATQEQVKAVPELGTQQYGCNKIDQATGAKKMFIGILLASLALITIWC